VQVFASHKSSPVSLPKLASAMPESRRFSHVFMSRPGKMSIKSGDGLNPDQNQDTNEKARFICLERLMIFQSLGARNSQSGLGRFSKYV
jgi:hypothetical protein